jgi:HK97 gp10 family phage protein
MATRVIVVFNHLDACAAVALSAADDLSTDVAKDMHQAAQAAAPVRTGALRRGITLEEGNPATVTASSLAGGGLREYAAYNEFGTRYMSANPFMMPGFVAGLAQVPVHGRAYGNKIEAAA